MKRWLLLTVIVAVLGVGCPVTALCQGTPGNEVLSDSKAVMKHLPGVAIVVENLDKDALDTGLNTEILEKYTELKLKAAGVKVLTPKESLALPDQPYIYLRLTVVKIPKSTVMIYTFDVKLDETLRRESDHTLITGSTVWSQQYTGAVTSKVFPKAVHDVLRDFLIQFAKAYHTENSAK